MGIAICASAISRPTSAIVSTAASPLQIEGLINYKRGHITITDLKGLESFACECYSALNDGHYLGISSTESLWSSNPTASAKL